MTWSDRLKMTFRTFKNIAIPLYIWYFLYAVIIFASFFVALIPLGLIAFFLFGNGVFSNNFRFDSNFTHLSTSSLPFDNNLWPYYSMFHNTGALVFIILCFFALTILGLIAGSIFHAGIINLVRKGLQTKAYFGDFSAKGAMRILKWNMLIIFSFVVLFFLAVILLGLLGDTASFSRILFVLYFIGVGLLTILLSPWLASGSIYIQVRDDLLFKNALKDSWKFFRKNMQFLWGMILACLIFAILMSIIQNYTDEPLNLLVSFVFSPFMTIIPIVWTLTLMQEREGIILDSHLPAQTEAISTYPASQSDNADNSSDADNAPEDQDDKSIPADETDKSTPAEEKDISASCIENTVPVSMTQSDAESVSDIHSKDLSKDELSDVNQAHSELAENEINYCPICGQSISSVQAIYCSKCGTKIR